MVGGWPVGDWVGERWWRREKFRVGFAGCLLGRGVNGLGRIGFS